MISTAIKYFIIDFCISNVFSLMEKKMSNPPQPKFDFSYNPTLEEMATLRRNILSSSGIKPIFIGFDYVPGESLSNYD